MKQNKNLVIQKADRNESKTLSLKKNFKSFDLQINTLL